ncbi:PH domain-containing protein [Microbacterium sp. NC79]|uniref:PH domain-containing protein n=1 Tax=Microbacterium sp. NC79 TaxID=2851009 RepID=UPI001C2C69E6|nr:PH domain-containing protein [Microbacterium sp. NC79]MBV0895792.1 PH domain-containing protein [Microbacterium sp. NC79]
MPSDAPHPVLDDGTFTTLKTARSAKRLELDGTWHQISPKYVREQLLANGLLLLIPAAAVVAMLLDFIPNNPWIWILLGAGSAVLLFTMIITPRQARAIGYRLRDDDLVFRKGILWQRIVAVPYGRMQLVDISHGPMDRGFGLAQLKMVTAAATTGVTIPGLTQEAAEVLRDTLIDVAETRRTGL